MTLSALALVAALHAPTPAARARALAPLLEREARAHHLPPRLLRAVAAHESTFRAWAIGDHHRAFGLFQVHRDAVPGVTFTREELMRPDVNAHAAALRLELARRRCGGLPEHWVDNFNGARCGRDKYHLGKVASR